MSEPKPILYSFRRCPYAMRARLAVQYSQMPCELREVVLKNKPQAMLDVSPKGTVPVLLMNDGQVIEESIEIINFALTYSDPDNWLEHPTDHSVIQRADEYFKYWLDRYKYADRYPESSEQDYFDKAVLFLQELEGLMESSGNVYFIDSANITTLDIALFPFVRQFAFVDKVKFDQLPLPKLQAWLDYFLHSSLFSSIMDKYPMWVEGKSEIITMPVAASCLPSQG